MSHHEATPGTVSWVDVSTDDLEKSRAFYKELLGWSYIRGDDPQMGFYTIAQIGGKNVAGIAKQMQESPFPVAWSVYFASESADEIAKRVEAEGGKVLFPPMDIMEEGRMAFFTDPTGAMFGVWQAKNHKGAELRDVPGAMCWHEVYSSDVQTARDFYCRVFGLEARRLEAPDMEYYTLHKGPHMVAGVMQLNEDMHGSQSRWNTYFSVRDADAAAEKLAALGGTLTFPPMDTPYGRMLGAIDPAGASFCLIDLSKAKN